MKLNQALERLSRATRVVVERMEDRRMFSALSPSASQLVFSTIQTSASGGGPSAPQTLALTDTGSSTLKITSISILNDPNSLTQDAGAFQVNSSSLPLTLAPNQSANLSVVFSTSTTAIRSAILRIQDDEATNPTLDITLRGIGTAGYYDNLQPGLQTILNLYQIPVVTGDPTPNTAYFNGAPTNPNDEILAQQFAKAGSGPVTITPLAVYDIGSPVAERFGFYTPGSPSDKTELFTIDGSASANEQTVNPNPLGATSFDPGASTFGLYATFPHFADGSGNARVSYSEDSLNTWDANSSHKMRAYALKNANGSVVPNAYVVAFEDYDLNNYFTSMVAIVRNVKPLTAGPVLGLQNLNGLPNTDRLAFNRVQTPSAYDPSGFTDIVDDTNTLQINNTGTQPLVISGLTLSDSTNWALVNPPAPGTTIAAGKSLDVKVKFIAQSAPTVPYNETNDSATTDGTPVTQAGGVWNGTLTVSSNDPTNPTRTVQLAGYWQKVSESEMEPGLQTITNLLLGYGTNISNTVLLQYPNNGATPTYYGEELQQSAYWNVADPSQAVSVVDLAAWHGQYSGTTATVAQLFWYAQGSPNAVNRLIVQGTGNSQSLFPSAYGAPGTAASATFTPSGTFGFNIDGEASDNSVNTTDISLGRSGHAVRFFPLRDGGGNLIPNTWLMVMDYEAGSYDNADFQDNAFIVTNARPASQAPAVTDLEAVGAANSVSLQWAPVSDTSLVGYNVYSSSSPTGTFIKLNSSPISRTSFIDTSAAANAPTYYRVTAVDSSGESQAANASAQPLGALLTTLVSADINSQPAGSTTVVTPGSAYTVTGGGVDIAGTSADGFRYVSQEVNGDFDATVQVSSLSQNVLSNSRAGLMVRESLDAGSRMIFAGPTATNGYRFNYRTTEGQVGVYNTIGTVSYPNAWVRLVRKGNNFTSYSSSDGVNWMLLGTLEMTLPSTLFLGMAVSSHSTTQTVTAQFQHYSVSTIAAVSAPATPTNLTALPSATGITLQWAANTESNLAGYYVYSSASASGPFTKLNATALTSPTFIDTTAAANAVTYYQVVAANSANLLSSPASISATLSSATGASTIFSTTSAPASNLQNVNDPTISSSGGVELGLKFRSDVAGVITGVRFYKGSLEGGTQTGELWSGTGQLLATATFTNESASGWQQVNLASPVSIAANTTYIVSYHTTSPYLAYTPGIFSSGNVDNAPLHALANGVDGNNSVYNYGASSFPTTYNGQAANYWVDVVFSTTAIVGPTAPSSPTNLTAAAASPTQVTLNWSASVGTVTAYHVERSTDGINFTEVAGNVTGTTYTDATAQAGSAYTYRVRAENSGAFSGYSNTKQVTTAPATPTGLAATSVTSASVGLTWIASAGATGYQVVRKGPTDVGYVQIGTPTTITYTDSTVLASTNYSYEVIATSAAGVSPASSPLSVNTALSSSAPATPANLNATPSAAGIALQWTANTENNLAGYNVLRASSAAGPFTQLNSVLLTSPSYNDTTAPQGVISYYQVVAVNTSALSSAPATVSATRPAAAATTSIFASTAAPASNLQNVNDPTIASSGGVELGMKFRSDVSGFVTGVRFWKGSQNTATHTGELWSSTGQLLATAIFTSESGSGWQQVTFSSPVAITANTIYVVSYHTSATFIAYAPSAFATSGIDNAPLHALQTGVSGGNGVYNYGASSFPTVSNGQSPSYWVDVVFSASAPVMPVAPSAPSALVAIATSSGPVNLSWTASTGTVTAYHVERSADGITFTDIAGNVTAASYTDSTTQTSTTYTYRVRAENSGAFSGYGNTQQVTTAAAALPTSIFSSSAAPASNLQNVNDNAIPTSGGVELGMKFQTSVAGTITGVRFWKGSLNTGTHTGELWSSTGQLLATATFSNETASGWQQVTFSTPVAIAANTTYIVSYHTNAAYIAYTPGTFATAGVDNSELHALASGVDGSNGVYKYGAGGFPTLSNNQSPNYWVDVVFNPNT